MCQRIRTHMKIRTMVAVLLKEICRLYLQEKMDWGVSWLGRSHLRSIQHSGGSYSLQVREKIFVTCGTNGKTTTNNMLCAALEQEGRKAVCNHTGSNMLNGVVAFVLAAGPTGSLDADYAQERHEASTRHVFPMIKARR